MNEMTQETFQIPSPEEINKVLREANQMRAETMKALLGSLGRGVLRGLAAVASVFATIARSFADAREAQQLYQKLSSLSERELNDIGLTRDDIPAVVAGTFRGRDEAASGPANGAEVTALRPARSAPAPDVREAA